MCGCYMAVVGVAGGVGGGGGSTRSYESLRHYIEGYIHGNTPRRGGG